MPNPYRDPPEAAAIQASINSLNRALLKVKTGQLNKPNDYYTPFIFLQIKQIKDICLTHKCKIYDWIFISNRINHQKDIKYHGDRHILITKGEYVMKMSIKNKTFSYGRAQHYLEGEKWKTKKKKEIYAKIIAELKNIQEVRNNEYDFTFRFTKDTSQLKIINRIEKRNKPWRFHRLWEFVLTEYSEVLNTKQHGHYIKYLESIFEEIDKVGINTTFENTIKKLIGHQPI